MDVLRPLALGQLLLGPGEVEVDVRVEGFLRRRHARQFDGGELQKASRHALDARRGTATTSKRTSSPSASGCAASQASAARRRRRCFSASTISSGSPKPSPRFSFTSQKTSRRPRRTTTSSSLPPPRRSWPGCGSRAGGTTTARARRAPAAETCREAMLRPRVHDRDRLTSDRRPAAPAPPRSSNRAPGTNGGGSRRPPLADDLRVAGRDVADVRGEAVLREERVDPAASTGRASTLATIEAAAIAALFSSPSTTARVRRRRRPEPEAVDEAGLGRRATARAGLRASRRGSTVQPVAVDRPVRDHAHRRPARRSRGPRGTAPPAAPASTASSR